MTEQTLPDNVQFKRFAETVKGIEQHLSDLLQEQPQRLTNTNSFEKYLISKLSESLAMIFQKDFSDYRHWQTLISFANVGALEAAHVQTQAAQAASSGKVMTPAAQFSYDQYIASGWTDEKLIAEGLMLATQDEVDEHDGN